VPSPEHQEPRHIAIAVLDVPGDDLRALELGRALGRDRRGVSVPAHRQLHSLRRRKRCLGLRLGEASFEELSALPQRLRVGENHLHLIGPRPGLRHQVVFDGKQQFRLDLQRRLVDENVQRFLHRAVDQILDGNHACVRHP